MKTCKCGDKLLFSVEIERGECAYCTVMKQHDTEVGGLAIIYVIGACFAALTALGFVIWKYQGFLA